MKHLLPLAIILLLSPTHAFSEITTQIDANGNIVYTNMGPQRAKKKINTSNPTVTAYYAMATALKDQYLVIKGRKKATEEIIVACSTTAETLNGHLTPFAEGDITGRRARKVVALQGVGSTLSAQADIAKQLGKKNERLVLALKSQYCYGLSMLLVAESYFEEKGIRYSTQELNDSACFESSTRTESTISNFTAPSVRSQKMTITSFCRNKWATDYEMTEYCIKNQTEALQILQRYSGEILYNCSEKWGDDFEMTEYCTKNQTEAKNRLAM